MQLVERYCTWRWGEEGGGVFIIEKETMLNMVKLCVIPEKKKNHTPPPPQNFHSRRVFFNSHYLEFPSLFQAFR